MFWWGLTAGVAAAVVIGYLVAAALVARGAAGVPVVLLPPAWSWAPPSPGRPRASSTPASTWRRACRRVRCWSFPVAALAAVCAGVAAVVAIGALAAQWSADRAVPAEVMRLDGR